MSRHKKYFIGILCGLLLYSANCVTAQVQFTLPQVKVKPGDTAYCPLVVKNFKNISTMTMNIVTDTSIAKFGNIDQIELDGFSEGALSYVYDHEFQFLRIIWISPDAFVGSTIDDDKPLFRLKYHTVGKDKDSSYLNIVDDNVLPLIIEISDTSGQILMHTVKQGGVKLDMNVAVNDPLKLQRPLFEAELQHGLSSILVKYQTSSPKDSRCIIINDQGREIMQEILSAGTGVQEKEIQIPKKYRNSILYAKWIQESQQLMKKITIQAKQ